MSLRAEPDADGASQRVSVYRDGYLADTVKPAEFEQRFGIHGFDLSAYDVAGLQLSWEVDLQLQHASGSLAVLGGTAPACLTEPPAPISDGVGGMGTAGCAGIDFAEVEQASF